MHSKTDPQPRLLNGRLAEVLAGLRHGETIFVADAGMGVSPAALRPLPPHVEQLDLGVVTGVPSMGQLLPVIAVTGDIERAIVSEDLAGSNPALRAKLDETFGAAAVAEVPYYPAMYDLRDRAKLFVQTGDVTPHANVVLVGGYTSPDIAIELLTADDPMGLFAAGTGAGGA